MGREATTFYKHSADQYSDNKTRCIPSLWAGWDAISHLPYWKCNHVPARKQVFLSTPNLLWSGPSSIFIAYVCMFVCFDNSGFWSLLLMLNMCKLKVAFFILIVCTFTPNVLHFRSIHDRKHINRLSVLRLVNNHHQQQKVESCKCTHVYCVQNSIIIYTLPTITFWHVLVLPRHIWEVLFAIYFWCVLNSTCWNTCF